MRILFAIIVIARVFAILLYAPAAHLCRSARASRLPYRSVCPVRGAEDELARNAAFHRSRCEKTRVNSRLTGQKGRLTGIYRRFAQISKRRLRFIAEIVVLLL